jgi:hypothetical protein
VAPEYDDVYAALATGRWSPLPDSALRPPDDPWSPVAIGPGPWAAG